MSNRESDSEEPSAGVTQTACKNRRLFTGLLALWLAAIIFASQTGGIWEWVGLISMLAISVPMGIILTYERYPL